MIITPRSRRGLLVCLLAQLRGALLASAQHVHESPCVPCGSQRAGSRPGRHRQRPPARVGLSRPCRPARPARLRRWQRAALCGRRSLAVRLDRFPRRISGQERRVGRHRAAEARTRVRLRGLAARAGQGLALRRSAVGAREGEGRAQRGDGRGVRRDVGKRGHSGAAAILPACSAVLMGQRHHCALSASISTARVGTAYLSGSEACLITFATLMSHGRVARHALRCDLHLSL